MTGAEIGIILLVVAYLLHFIVFATYTAQTDRELYELRHRVTMLEMQKDGEQACMTMTLRQFGIGATLTNGHGRTAIQKRMMARM